MTRRRLGGLLLLLAITYLLGELWAAAGWEGRPYRWTVDAISALGVPEALHGPDGPATSTRHAVMNATFIGSGLRVAAAGLVLAPFVPRRGRAAVLGLVLVHATGLAIVGLFPTSTVGLRASMHGLGAWLGVVGGSVLLVAITISLARTRPALATFTGVCAAISLTGSVVAVVGQENFGLYERIAVDSVVGWQIVVGSVLLASARGRSVGQGE